MARNVDSATLTSAEARQPRASRYTSDVAYDPTDCIMFTRDPVGFCCISRRAIARVIEQYSH